MILSLCFYLSYGNIEEGAHCPTAESGGMLVEGTGM